jgi:hypothetical protein
MLRRVIIAVLLLCGSFSMAAGGDNPTGTLDWLRQQVKSNHGVIDLDTICPGSFAPKSPGAGDPCRIVHAADIVTLLEAGDTDAERIQIIKADVDGDINLDGATIRQELYFDQCIIRGNLSLQRSHWNNSLLIEHSHVIGAVTAEGMRVEGNWNFMSSNFDHSVDLSESRFNMKGDFQASNFKKLRIEKASIQDGLYMNGHSTFGEVEINYLSVGGNLEMEASTFNENVGAEGINVHGDVFLGQGEFKQPVTMTFANIAGKLDLTEGTFSKVDLTDTTVGQELVLGSGLTSPQAKKALHWSPPSPGAALILRNAHARTFQSRLEQASNNPIDDWPDHVDLDGFIYDELDDHSFEGTKQRLRAWEKWLTKSTGGAEDGAEATPFNPQPYALLAKRLDDQGERDAANELRYIAREKERADAATVGGWLSGRWWLLSALKWLIGYGIGFGPFKVVYWVIGSILLGVLLLLPSREARHKGVLWCVGATTERLLPIIELNKEFADFFDDQRRKRLAGWQIAFFSVYALWGWLLGLLLVAAMSGLTQAP